MGPTFPGFPGGPTCKRHHNHGARCADTIYFAARYFNQYYELKPTEKWLTDVRTYWKPQMTSFIPAEGTDQGTATLLPATDYALAENVEAFLTRDILGSIADKGLIVSSGGSAMGTTPSMTWNFLAAHVLDDPTYLRPIADNVMAYRLPWRTSRAVGRSFWDGRLPAAKSAISDWVLSVPVSRLYHENPRAPDRLVIRNR
jgi:hypothetical protein